MWGSSRISRTEKLEFRGIFISKILKEEREIEKDDGGQDILLSLAPLPLGLETLSAKRIRHNHTQSNDWKKTDTEEVRVRSKAFNWSFH